MSEDGIIREPMLDIYIFEATQLMVQLEEISIDCEKNKNIGTEAINEIFRIMHTLKSSSAMMTFNNIAILAHSIEDLFYFIRENKAAYIDFEDLFDLVLSGIDFIKGEILKIENDYDADGSSDNLVLKSSSLLENMKESNGAIIKNDAVQQEQNTMYCEYPNVKPSIEFKQKYFAKIFYEDGCEMENVRAFTVVHNLKDITYEMYYIPEDIIECSNSSDDIRRDGFLIGFSTSVSKEKVEQQLNQIVFLRDLELLEVDEYPPELKALENKNKIIIEDPTLTGPALEVPTEQIQITKEEDKHITKNGKQQSIISVNISKLDMLLDLVGEIVISEAMVTKNPDLEGLQLDNFNKASRQLRKLTNELQDILEKFLATTYS